MSRIVALRRGFCGEPHQTMTQLLPAPGTDLRHVPYRAAQGRILTWRCIASTTDRMPPCRRCRSPPYTRSYQNALKVSLSDCIKGDMARTVGTGLAFIDEKSAPARMCWWHASSSPSRFLSCRRSVSVRVLGPRAVYPVRGRTVWFLPPSAVASQFSYESYAACQAVKLILILQ